MLGRGACLLEAFYCFGQRLERFADSGEVHYVGGDFIANRGSEGREKRYNGGV